MRKRKRKSAGEMLYEQRQERKRYLERKMGFRDERQPVKIIRRPKG